MSPTSVTIFTSILTITPSLRKVRPELPLIVISDPALGGFGGTVEFDPAQLLPTTLEQLAAAEILITEPAVLASILKNVPNAFPNLRWCQSTYAGVDPMFPLTIQPPWTLTRFAGKFGPPMAEWCLARIISHERSFAASSEDQRQHAWAGSRTLVTNYRYLSDLTLTVLGGDGDIGWHIARAARLLGMHVVGYVRSHQCKGPSRENVLDKRTTNLNEALQLADYIVGVLPSTPTTKGLLNGDALHVCAVEYGGMCPVLINVGRGDLIDEPSLLRALDQGYIAGAILDVLPEEPLPSTSLLWDRKDVVVSPHVSAMTRGSDVPQVFLENYDLFSKGKPLKHVVDWEKGY